MRRLTLACMAMTLAAVSGGATVEVDFTDVIGPVKPVNGVGQPPMIGMPRNAPLFRYLKDAGIPYSRLHDVGGVYGQMRYVDIPNVFRDFSADENDPKNYDFAFTDVLMKSLDAHGVEPFYRLGVTIENDVAVARYRLAPPKDFMKWARICEHVIRHYTEGWANGFRMRVTYWEIWNEPENYEEPEKNCLWYAPFSEYIRLYGTVAPHLKAKFPHLKIGGYGSCGFYAGAGSESVAAAHSNPRTAYFVKCAKEFLSAVRANGWPLDFFSYHSYSAPKEALRQVAYADELLNDFGFSSDRTERISNEWLPYVAHGNLGSALQAAGVAAELIGLQNGPCDLACVYDARCGVGAYSPLFNPLTYKPHKAYYAFTAFNVLRKCGQAVRVTTDGTEGLYACAAKGGGDAAIMLANDSDAPVSLVVSGLDGYEVVEIRCTAADQTDAILSPADLPRDPVLPPRSFAVARLRLR